MDARPDPELLAAALTGDGEAFAVFYRRHVGRITAFHLSRVAHTQQAGDLTAETFAAALESLHRFDPARGEPIGWLFGIARHQLATLLRRGAVEERARRRMGMERIALDDQALEQIEATAGSERVHVEVRDGFAELPADQREAIALRVLLDHDYADTAVRTGVSEAVARKRVSRGLATLRARLAGKELS
jgi:RNA polymerase sigma factor (sigma-70 family)